MNIPEKFAFIYNINQKCGHVTIVEKDEVRCNF